MTPEELARQDIDRQLVHCGWVIQDRNAMNISAAQGVAVREFAMLTGEADYLLYVGGKVIGVVEAKPKGHPLIGVESQSAKYVVALLNSPVARRYTSGAAFGTTRPRLANPCSMSYEFLYLRWQNSGKS